MTGFELLAEVVDYLGHIGFRGNRYFFLCPIGKTLCNGFVRHFNGSNGIATDIGKAIVVRVVVATLQKNAVGEFVPDLQVDAHGCNRVREDFFVMCL